MSWINVEQNTEEWFNLRVGKPTSSNFGKIMANYGKAFGDPAKKYAEKIALEIATGQRDESSQLETFHTIRGHQLEPLAKSRYEVNNFVDVSNGGFNVIKFGQFEIGDSPDGIVGKNSIEIKSVIPSTHWKRLKNGGYDTAYKWQIHGHIWVGGCDWCDFVSYCPEMPEGKQLYVYRVYRDEELIQKMKSRMIDFFVLIKENLEILK